MCYTEPCIHTEIYNTTVSIECLACLCGTCGLIDTYSTSGCFAMQLCHCGLPLLTMTTHDHLAVHVCDVTHWHSNSQHGSLQVSQQKFATSIDSKACRKYSRQLGQTRLLASVREDVNAHISSQGVIAEDPGGGLQGGMPCQAAPLQQRHSFIVNDPHHLQPPFHMHKCLMQACTITAGNWLQAALNLLYAAQPKEAWDQLGITSSFSLKHPPVPFCVFVQTSISEYINNTKRPSRLAIYGDVSH